MHPYDDIEPDMMYPLTVRTGYLCASCNFNKVVHLGDYCPTCAVIPPDYDEYYIISPGVLTLVSKKSNIPLSFLKAKMERCFERYQHYVVFRSRGQWHDIVISEKFHIPTVMKALFKRLED